MLIELGEDGTVVYGCGGIVLRTQWADDGRAAAQLVGFSSGPEWAWT